MRPSTPTIRQVLRADRLVSVFGLKGFPTEAQTTKLRSAFADMTGEELLGLQTDAAALSRDGALAGLTRSLAWSLAVVCASALANGNRSPSVRSVRAWARAGVQLHASTT
jgi:hypothetical protein